MMNAYLIHYIDIINQDIFVIMDKKSEAPSVNQV
jgi:hypothetical protein